MSLFKPSFQEFVGFQRSKVSPFVDEDDERSWVPSKKDEAFSVKSCYEDMFIIDNDDISTMHDHVDRSLDWIAPHSVMTFIWAWDTKTPTTPTKFLRFCLPFAVWWNLWMERNRRQFEGRDRRVNEIIMEIKASLFSWARNHEMFKDLNFTDLAFGWEKYFV
ncbi:hypothetical protein BVC80_7525g5 [Macleaya cordata]|uniref:Uncharacterized protein n=1 Tax=Macleaya cordata TaxID=56857 RepID=A0A200Q2Z1_MACCD|nr:hypothetical protein BVC80_7525g5 [Macleaya cordata]